MIGEAMGGLRHVTGTPDRPPSRTGISIGDTLSALYGVIGAMMALEQRRKTGAGQVVDVALYESVFSVMESMLPEFDAFGVVRERTGSILPGIAPTSAYRCSDGSYVLIAGNGDSIFKRLCARDGPRRSRRRSRARAQRRPRRAARPGSTAKSRRGRRRARPTKCSRRWQRAEVPASKIYTIATSSPIRTTRRAR